MLKPTVKRNLMLDFVGEKFLPTEKTHPARVYKLNDKKIKSEEIVYLINREFRLVDNWGFNFALNLAKKNNLELKIVLFLDSNRHSKRQIEFLKSNLDGLLNALKKSKIKYKIAEKDFLDEIKDAAAVVTDFNPVFDTNWAIKADFSVFEVDSHNITPARLISDKKEHSAATLRRKIYMHIAEFLTEFPPTDFNKNEESDKQLKDFIQNKLDCYTERKNDPNKDMTSRLSPYLHFGLISAQRIALEVLKSEASRENKEAFLEELIVRKELSDNFCLYKKDFKSINSLDNWAKATLEAHNLDVRTYIYSVEEFESAKTHDRLWNAAQNQLLKEGRIHGFLRMYWAKKILEWSNTAENAINIAIYLNDKYALDGCDPNGYVGILWSIGGVHDRAFSSRNVFGKIRYMSLEGCKKKFDVERYIKKQIP